VGANDSKYSRDQRLNVPSEARARDNKFLVTHTMTDQRSLTSKIAREAHLPRGPQAPQALKRRSKRSASKTDEKLRTHFHRSLT
jgi:hypothetical protein